jgi:hypothetical protein
MAHKGTYTILAFGVDSSSLVPSDGKIHKNINHCKVSELGFDISTYEYQVNVLAIQPTRSVMNQSEILWINFHCLLVSDRRIGNKETHLWTNPYQKCFYPVLWIQ